VGCVSETDHLATTLVVEPGETAVHKESRNGGHAKVTVENVPHPGEEAAPRLGCHRTAFGKSNGYTPSMRLGGDEVTVTVEISHGNGEVSGISPGPERRLDRLPGEGHLFGGGPDAARKDLGSVCCPQIHRLDVSGEEPPILPVILEKLRPEDHRSPGDAGEIYRAGEFPLRFKQVVYLEKAAVSLHNLRQVRGEARSEIIPVTEQRRELGQYTRQ
jgi:hypothetical protein